MISTWSTCRTATCAGPGRGPEHHPDHDRRRACGGQGAAAPDGKLDGMAMRVPTPTGSVVDLVAEVKKPATVEAVNAAMKAHAEGPLKGILSYCDEPIVSVDVQGDPAQQHLRCREHRRARRDDGEDRQLVRQRVGLQLPRGRSAAPAREGRLGDRPGICRRAARGARAPGRSPFPSCRIPAEVAGRHRRTGVGSPCSRCVGVSGRRRRRPWGETDGTCFPREVG